MSGAHSHRWRAFIAGSFYDSCDDEDCDAQLSVYVAAIERERDAVANEVIPALEWMASFEDEYLYANTVTTLHIDMVGRAKQVLAAYRRSQQEGRHDD